MTERVLVTGGAGYIGSVAAHQLASRGYEVTVLDDLSRGHAEAVPPGMELVVGDIADAGTVEALFSSHRFDAVMHFAAFIEAGESMRAPEKYFRNNCSNALVLFESVIRNKVPRVVFSSTAAVYGSPACMLIDENTPLAPTNAYGESKLQVERMLSWFHRVHGLRYAALRYFNAAGATNSLGEDHQPESHLIPLTLQVAQGVRDSVAVYGRDYPTTDGTCVRDYIHVSDLASAHLLVLEALKDAEALTYNLGNGQGFSVREVIATTRKVTGHDIPARDEPRRPGDPAYLVADSQRIRKELNWAPQIAELESIVRSAWEWRQQRPHGYNKNEK